VQNTGSTRRNAAETRRRVIDATVELLEEQGARGLNVSRIMERAGVSRTAFYRQFPDVYAVVSEVLAGIADQLAVGAAPWFRDPDAVGSVDVIVPNAIRSGRVIKPLAKLIQAIVDAAGYDETLRGLWREGVVRARIDATAWAIRRDQAAGVVRPSIDPEATALALTLMGEHVVLEILGRQDGSPEQYARIVAPVWEAVLFGTHRIDDAHIAVLDVEVMARDA
jgi:AcrR family transcriptional regulator